MARRQSATSAIRMAFIFTPPLKRAYGSTWENMQWSSRVTRTVTRGATSFVKSSTSLRPLDA